MVQWSFGHEVETSNAWQIRWDDIDKVDKEVKALAERLWDSWKDNPDVSSMNFWDVSVRRIIGAVHRRYALVLNRAACGM